MTPPNLHPGDTVRGTHAAGDTATLDVVAVLPDGRVLATQRERTGDVPFVPDLTMREWERVE